MTGGTKNQKVAITHLAIGIDTQVTHHVVAMEKVAEQHIMIFQQILKMQYFSSEK